MTISAEIAAHIAAHDQLRKTIFYPKTDVAHEASLYAELKDSRDQDLASYLQFVHDLCLDRFQVSPVQIVPINSGGTFHLLYKVDIENQSVVVRLNRLKDHRPAWEFLLDAWIYPKIFSIGLPGPSVVAIDCSRSRFPTDYQILTYVQGKSLSAFQDPETQYINPVLLQAIGAYVAQVHSVELTGFGPLSLAFLDPSIQSLTRSLPAVAQVAMAGRQDARRCGEIKTLCPVRVLRYDCEMQSTQDARGPFYQYQYPVRGECFGQQSWTKCIEPMNSSAQPSPVGIHSNWQDYIFLRLEEHIEICTRILAITPAEAHELYNIFLDHKQIFSCPDPVLLHGDLGNHNFLSHDGISINGLIDWEDCMSGDPVFDIAYWGTFFRDHMLKDFLIGYTKHATLPVDFELRYWLYYLRIALSKTVHRFRFGYKDYPGRPAPSLRIQKAIKNILRLP